MGRERSVVPVPLLVAFSFQINCSFFIFYSFSFLPNAPIGTVSLLFYYISLVFYQTGGVPVSVVLHIVPNEIALFSSSVTQGKTIFQGDIMYIWQKYIHIECLNFTDFKGFKIKLLHSVLDKIKYWEMKSLPLKLKIVLTFFVEINWLKATARTHTIYNYHCKKTECKFLITMWFFNSNRDAFL